MVISNSVILTTCLRSCKSVKPIIFISPEHLEGNGDLFRLFCSHMGNLIVNLDDHFDKLTFFITRNKKMDYFKACSAIRSKVFFLFSISMLRNFYKMIYIV
jgi:hypothetical protein